MQPTPYARRQAALVRTALSYTDLIFDALGEEPATHSQAAKEREDQDELGGEGLGSTPVKAAQVDVLYRIGAARDHAEAFCSLMTAPRPASFALPALLRACLESCGRAHWHLRSPSARKRVIRWASDRLSSMNHSQKVHHMAYGIVNDDTKRKIERLTATLSRLQFKTEGPPSYVALVTGLFDGIPDIKVEVAYALNAGISHGETWALRELMVEIEGKRADGIATAATVYSDRNVAAMVGYILAAFLILTREVAELFAIEQGTRTQVETRLMDALSQAMTIAQAKETWLGLDPSAPPVKAL